MQNLTHTKFANLDVIYLKDKEWIYILGNVLDLNYEQINKFKEMMEEKIKLAKHDKYDKILRYARKNEFNICFFLKEACKLFEVINMQKQMRLEETEDTTGNESDYIEENSSENSVNKEIKKTKRGLKQLMEVQFSQNHKEEKKKQLIEELKETVKLTNQYKISCIRMLAYLDQLDPQFSTIKSLLEEQRLVLNKIKKEKIQGKLLESFVTRASTQITSYLENGTNLKSNFSKSLLKDLIVVNKDQYKMLLKRKAEEVPFIKKLIKNLMLRIFNEKFTFFKGKQNKNMEMLQSELEKIFGKFNNLKNSDYVILNTVFRNYDSNNLNEISMDNVLDKVSSKLLNMVDRVFEDEEILEENEGIVEEDEKDEKEESSYQSVEKITSKIDKNILSQISKDDQKINIRDNNEEKEEKNSSNKKKSRLSEDKRYSFAQEKKQSEIKKSSDIDFPKKKESLNLNNQKIKEALKDEIESLESEDNMDYLNRIDKEARNTVSELRNKKKDIFDPINKKNWDTFENKSKNEEKRKSDIFKRDSIEEIGVLDLMNKKDNQKLEDLENQSLAKKKSLLEKKKEKNIERQKKISEPFLFEDIREKVPSLKKPSIQIELDNYFKNDDKDNKDKPNFFSDIKEKKSLKSVDKHKSDVIKNNLYEKDGLMHNRSIQEMKEDAERVRKSIEKQIRVEKPQEKSEDKKDSYLKIFDTKKSLGSQSRDGSLKKGGRSYTHMFKDKVQATQDRNSLQAKLLNRISNLTEKSKISLSQKDDVTSKSPKSKKSIQSKYSNRDSINTSNRTNKTDPLEINKELSKKNRQTKQDIYDINKDILAERESLQKIRDSLKYDTKNDDKRLSLKNKERRSISNKNIDQDNEGNKRNFFKKNNEENEIVENNEKDNLIVPNTNEKKVSLNFHNNLHSFGDLHNKEESKSENVTNEEDIPSPIRESLKKNDLTLSEKIPDDFYENRNNSNLNNSETEKIIDENEINENISQKSFSQKDLEENLNTKESLIQPSDILLSQEPRKTFNNKLRDQTINQSDVRLNKNTNLNSLEIDNQANQLDSKISEKTEKNSHESNKKSEQKEDQKSESEEEEVKDKLKKVFKDNTIFNKPNANIKMDKITTRNSLTSQSENIFESHIGADSFIDYRKTSLNKEINTQRKTGLKNNEEIGNNKKMSVIKETEEVGNNRKSSIRQSQNKNIDVNKGESKLSEINENDKKTKLTQLSPLPNEGEMEKQRKISAKNSLMDNKINNSIISEKSDLKSEKELEKNVTSIKSEESRISELPYRELKVNLKNLDFGENSEVLDLKEQTRYNSLYSDKGKMRNKIATTIEPFEDFKQGLEKENDYDNFDLNQTINLNSSRMGINEIGNHNDVRISDENQIKNFFKSKFK